MPFSLALRTSFQNLLWSALLVRFRLNSDKFCFLSTLTFGLSGSIKSPTSSFLTSYSTPFLLNHALMWSHFFSRLSIIIFIYHRQKGMSPSVSSTTASKLPCVAFVVMGLVLPLLPQKSTVLA